MFCSVKCVKQSWFVLSNVLSSHGLFCQMCKEALFFPLWNVFRSPVLSCEMCQEVCLLSELCQEVLVCSARHVKPESQAILTLGLVDLVLSHHNLPFFNPGSLLPFWKLDPSPHPTHPPPACFQCCLIIPHCFFTVCEVVQCFLFQRYNTLYCL